MAARFYRPELDALRLFAFCMIFCDHINPHVWWWSVVRDMGAFGMPLFFILSAYLIVTLLLREQEETGNIAVRAFFVRRILRIWPLYFAVVGGGLLLGQVWKTAALPGAAGASLLFLVANFFVATHGWVLAWATPLWSLSVEEQFYLAVPAAIKAGVHARHWIAAGSAIAVLVSYAALWWLGSRGAIPNIGIWVNSLVELQFFAMGCLIALWRHGRVLRLRGSIRIVLLAASAVTWWLGVQYFHLRVWTTVAPATLVAGYAVLLAGTCCCLLGVLDSPVRFPNWVIFLGKRTYGLYVFHFLFIWLVTQTGVADRLEQSLPGTRYFFAAVATVILAALSYRFFESPFLRLKGRFERVHSRPV